MVTFTPKSNDPKAVVSTGATTKDGTFELMTGTDEGAPAGEYSVTMIWMQEVAGGSKKPVPGTMNVVTPMEDKLKGRYSDRKRPALSDVTITKGTNALNDFKLQ